MFRLQEHGTNVRTELLAGLTTYMTMVYIVFVNPAILSQTGMDKGAVFVATCLAAAFGSALMGLYANYPVALAPGMGLNAYFTYSVVKGLGVPWQAALGAVFVSGVLFLLVSVTPVRAWIIDGISNSLKLAISVGIGFFLFHSLKNMTSLGWKPKVVKSDITFADVAGQPETKAELAEMLSFLKDSDAYRKTGAEAPKGVLLVGPPGTGKTLLAKALAGEASASFIALSGSDFANRFIGAGKERIEATFKVARKNTPCIIFIDEIDSVAANRDGSGTDGAREHTTTINKLLTEMDGFKKNEGIFVLAATNRIDVLDPAILRKGRFDRHIFVNVSDIKGREEILRVHTKEKPLGEDVDLNMIARGIAGFSGADIRNLVNEAAIHAARRNSDTLSRADFESARIKIIGGVERKSAVLDDADKKLIAVHESGHAVVAAHLGNADPIHIATIIPRGNALGMVVQLPEKDFVSIPKSKLLTRLKIYMGGRAAEEIVFGADEVTAGAASDIEEATRIATAMVTLFGMDPSVGMRKVERINGVLPANADAAVQRLLDEARTEARKILEENRAGLDRLTEALLVRETIYGDEVRQIVHGEAAARASSPVE